MDCGTCLAKYILCFFNCIFFIAGAVILGVGVWLYADKDSFVSLTKMVDENNLPKLEQTLAIGYIAYILMAAGAIIFILSLVGYCAALKESKCLLGLYGVLLVLILVLEITAAGLAYAYRDRVEDEMKSFLKSTIVDYNPVPNSDDAPSLFWNGLMVKMECCGVNNYTDFGESEKFKAKGDKTPAACCKMVNGTLLDPDCPKSPKLENSFYLTGCYQTVVDQFKQHFSIVIYVVVGIVTVELLATLLTFCLCKSLEPYDK